MYSGNVIDDLLVEMHKQELHPEDIAWMKMHMVEHPKGNPKKGIQFRMITHTAKERKIVVPWGQLFYIHAKVS